MQETSSMKEASIVLESLLGEGTFGKVYSGKPLLLCIVKHPVAWAL